MAVRLQPLVFIFLTILFAPSYAQFFQKKPGSSQLQGPDFKGLPIPDVDHFASIPGSRSKTSVVSPSPFTATASSFPASLAGTFNSTSVSLVSQSQAQSTLVPAITRSQSTPTSVPSQSQTNSFTTTPSLASSSLAIISESNSTKLMKRTAIAACLNDVELSCLNLAANCIDSVDGNNLNTIWGIASCAVAGTCYGVGALIDSINCQTGFRLGNADEESLDYDIYASAVGSCAFAPDGCPMTQQNYVDWYYGTLTAIGTANFPTSINVVVALFNTIKEWTATGNIIPYTNLNDWYHFSSFASPPTTATTRPPAYTPMTWNPNPGPSPGAVSETFVKSSSTVIIAVPTNTTTVVIVGATLTLAPGGTPIAGNVPTDITQPNAVTPTFNYNPIIPSTASSATFVAGTWTSVVAVPTSSESPVTITGPSNDGDDDDSDDSWLLILGLFGPVVSGTLPASVSVIDGLTPAPVPPPGWPDTGSGSWTPPPPPPPPPSGEDPDDPDDPDDPESNSCPFQTLPPFYPPYDPSGEEPDDPDAPIARRHLGYSPYINTTNITVSHLFKRASTRHIMLGDCGDSQAFSSVGLDAATWYTVNPPTIIPAVASAGTTLYITQGATHVSNDGKVKEHIFELRYIKDFVNANFVKGDCDWLRRNIWNNQIDGITVSLALAQAIDNVANLAWVADEINKAKSVVVNNQRRTPDDPPLKDKIMGIKSLDPAVSSPDVLQVETLIRALGVVGGYFTDNAAQYQASALRVQNILARLTPSSPIFPPLDTRWNEFIRNTVSTYSTGITSRAGNMLTAYRNRLNGLLRDAQAQQPPPNPPPSIPTCWPVFHDQTIAGRLANGGINWMNFVPPALAHPPCNTAGTLGAFMLYNDANNEPVFLAGNATHQIVALGNQFYGLSLAVGRIYYDIDLARFYGASCTGIHYIVSGGNGQAFPVATWDQDCQNAQGKALSKLAVISGGQRLVCFFNNANDGTNRFTIICGASRAVVQTCVTHMNQVDGYPFASMTDSFLRFSAL